MLTPTGTPSPHTAADTAYSAHSTQPALRPHCATLRVEDKPPHCARGNSVILLQMRDLFETMKADSSLCDSVLLCKFH